MIDILFELLKITKSDHENVQILKGKNKLPETIEEYKRLIKFK